MGKSVITRYLKLGYPSDGALTEILSLVQQGSTSFSPPPPPLAF
ncbi:hypothetical protein O9993_19155 [Vibrio lentus]|nr:hypothetical protein [Vibrio lentus]